jgi:tetratricopeptide (TPR) repeat protein
LAREPQDVAKYNQALAKTRRSLGSLLFLTGRSREAEQEQRQSLEILEKLAAQYPEVPDYRSRVGGSLNSIADVLMDRGNWEGARQLLEQALVHQQAALEIDPQQRSYKIGLCRHLENLIAVQLALGDQAAAARTAETCAHHLNTNGPCPKNLPRTAI